MADDRADKARARGRIPFVWVRDDTTGHAYDVPENAVTSGMTPVPGYELNFTGKARRTKYFVDKGGNPGSPAKPAVPESVEPPDVALTRMTGAAAETKAPKSRS